MNTVNGVKRQKNIFINEMNRAYPIDPVQLVQVKKEKKQLKRYLFLLICSIFLVAGCNQKASNAKQWKDVFDEMVVEAKKQYFPILEDDESYKRISFSYDMENQKMMTMIEYRNNKKNEYNLNIRPV